MTPEAPREPPRPTPASPRISPLPLAGMIGLACVVLVDLASLLVVDWWVVLLLMLAWVVLFVLALAWWIPHPTRLPWLVAFGFGVWVLVVIGGSIALAG